LHPYRTVLFIALLPRIAIEARCCADRHMNRLGCQAFPSESIPLQAAPKHRAARHSCPSIPWTALADQLPSGAKRAAIAKSQKQRLFRRITPRRPTLLTPTRSFADLCFTWRRCLCYATRSPTSLPFALLDKAAAPIVDAAALTSPILGKAAAPRHPSVSHDVAVPCLTGLPLQSQPGGCCAVPCLTRLDCRSSPGIA